MVLRSLFYFGVGFILLGALLSLFLPRARLRKIPLAFLVVGALSLLVFAVPTAWTGASETFSFFSIGPLEFSFIIDRLSAFFIAMLSVVSLAVGIYSFGYIEHYHSAQRKNLLVALMGLFILSMVLVVASQSMLSFFCFWEVMSFSSFLLVSFEYDTPGANKASLYYLVMTQISSMLLLAAFSIIYATTGSFAIQQTTLAAPLLTIVFLCLFIAFAIKAGAIPFHKWLPYAHPAAPSNISALMSGLMIKVAIYGLVRFLVTVLQPTLWWGLAILGAGALSAILGVIYALKEHDIKRLLAYHSIENIGIILMGIGLYVIFAAEGQPAIALLALAAALFHTLNHAIFKALLFLTAGSVVAATGTRNIEEMGGIVKRMPGTAVLFLLGAVAISALPPLNGFVSELMIFQAFFQMNLLASPFIKIFLVVCVSLFALTSALAAACFVKAFGIIFLGEPRSKEAKDAKEAPTSMLVGPAILAALCVVLGVFSYQFFRLLGIPVSVIPTPDLLLIGILLLVTYAIAWLALQPKATRVGATWACGCAPTGPRTEYTASGFSEPIVRIFSPIYRPRRIVERRYDDKHSATFAGGIVELRLMKFFEEYLYAPVALATGKVADWVAALQEQDLDTCIAYVFIGALIVIIVMRYAL